MHLSTMRLKQALGSLMLLFALQAQASPTYTADFTTAGLDPQLTANMYKNGVWSAGVVLPWIVTTGDGYLTLAKVTPLPSALYADGPHINSDFSVAGDFIATVKVDSTFNSAGGAGFFVDTGAGYTGISIGYNWLSDSAGIGYSSNGFNTSAPTMVTLQMMRVGTTLTKSYKFDGQTNFTVFSTTTASNIAGEAWFDLTNYAENSAAVRFSAYSIEQLAPVPEPGSMAMLLIGLPLIGLVSRRRKQTNNTKLS